MTAAILDEFVPPRGQRCDKCRADTRELTNLGHKELCNRCFREAVDSVYDHKNYQVPRHNAGMDDV